MLIRNIPVCMKYHKTEAVIPSEIYISARLNFVKCFSVLTQAVFMNVKQSGKALSQCLQ